MVKQHLYNRDETEELEELKDPELKELGEEDIEEIEKPKNPEEASFYEDLGLEETEEGPEVEEM